MCLYFRVCLYFFQLPWGCASISENTVCCLKPTDYLLRKRTGRSWSWKEPGKNIGSGHFHEERWVHFLWETSWDPRKWENPPRPCPRHCQYLFQRRSMEEEPFPQTLQQRFTAAHKILEWHLMFLSVLSSQHSNWVSIHHSIARGIRFIIRLCSDARHTFHWPIDAG